MPLTKAQLNEWCDVLEAHPERQHRGSLISKTEKKYCCLGQLAVLNGAKRCSLESDGLIGLVGLRFKSSTSDLKHFYFLIGDIEKQFGSEDGHFSRMGMPDLVYVNSTYTSATAANDSSVPWGVIAKHFRQHYKTLD